MQAERNAPRNLQIAYALFRFALGLDMFLHGVMRLPTLSMWVDTQTRLFANSFLPTFMVRGFLFALPIPEAIIGALLMIGYFTREALIAGSLTMIVLIFGTGTRQDWTTIGAQMLYVLYYYIMLARLEDNWLAVDTSRA
jgi:thiosulfate dehydrogenase [quinone] large subunit